MDEDGDTEMTGIEEAIDEVFVGVNIEESEDRVILMGRKLKMN